MCMCQPLYQRRMLRSFINKQGAAGNVIVLQPTKTAMTVCDTDLGPRDSVPALNDSTKASLLTQPSWRLFCRSFVR